MSEHSREGHQRVCPGRQVDTWEERDDTPVLQAGIEELSGRGGGEVFIGTCDVCGQRFYEVRGTTHE